MAASNERLPSYSLLPRADQISEDDDRYWAYLPQSQGIGETDSGEEYSDTCETCLICMEPADMVTGPLMKLNCSCVDSCGHLHCLNTWFVREHTCPTCRNPLSASDRLRFGIDGVPIGTGPADEERSRLETNWLEGVDGQEKVLIYYSRSFVGLTDDIGKCLFNLEAFCAGNYGLVVETVDEPRFLKIIFCSNGKELSGLMAESWLLKAEMDICGRHLEKPSRRNRKGKTNKKVERAERTERAERPERAKRTKKKKKSSSKCVIS